MDQEVQAGSAAQPRCPIAPPEGSQHVSSAHPGDRRDQNRDPDLPYRPNADKTLRIGSAQRVSGAQPHTCSQRPPEATAGHSPRAEPWTGLCAEVLPRVCTSWLPLCLPPSLPGSARGVFLPTEPPVRQECGLQRRVQPLFERGFVFRSSALRPGAQLPSLLRLRRRTHV